MDVFNKKKRSAVMAGIRSKNTKPELTVRRALHALGYRYILHDRRLPGCPDIVFPRYKLAIQIRGCFWHNHTCIDGHMPKSRVRYWRPKIEATKRRDQKNDRLLRASGWHLINIWECECTRDINRQIRRVSAALASGEGAQSVAETKARYRARRR